MLPRAAASLDEAHAAIELWEYYKKRTLDPAQRLAVEVMMATRADGLWAAPTTGREMPRQGGKGDEIEVVELWGLVQRSERILHTVHDAVLLATETQSRLLDGCIEAHPDLRRLKKRAWRGTGQQMIEMRNGGIVWYRTRTGGGARGVDEVDRIVVDESQHAEEEHLAAITPTQLASVNPQLNALGTAGIAGKSVWWWRQRRRALSADPGDFGYVGHTAESVCLDPDGRIVRGFVDVQDRNVWRRANPVLHRRPELVSYLTEQLNRLGEDLFAREHLGVWDAEPGEIGVEPKLPAGAWSAAVTQEPLAEDAPVTLAYEVSLDSKWSTVAVATGDQYAPYVAVLEHKQGTGWLTRDPEDEMLPGAIVKIARAFNVTRFACITTGPAGQQMGQIMLALSEAGLDLKLEPLSMVGYRQACGAFFTDVTEGRLRWFQGSGPLDVAAKDAAERRYGDSWSWDIRNATVPISPLVAATVARALLPVQVEPEPPKLARVYSF